MSSSFKIGDAVYYGTGHEIGIITDIIVGTDGRTCYRVRYCQGKDLTTGPRGGNGPVFREGYPQPVTAPADVLFVKALAMKQLIDDLQQHLDQAKADCVALQRARLLIQNGAEARKGEGG